jgi:hypothetical protein
MARHKINQVKEVMITLKQLIKRLIEALGRKPAYRPAYVPTRYRR